MPEPFTQLKIDPVKLDLHGLSEAEQGELRSEAIRAARSAGWLPGKGLSGRPKELFRDSVQEFKRLKQAVFQEQPDELSEDLRTLYDNFRLIDAVISDLTDSTKFLSKLPQVRTSTEEAIPRAIVLARALLLASKNRLTVPAFSFFIESVQEVEPLRLAELWGMLPALKLILLGNLADAGFKALHAFRGGGPQATSHEIGRFVTGLRLIGDLDWKETLEKLSVVHRILCLDPAGVYPKMDFDSREMYRQAIEKIAPHSDVSEIELARRLINTAQAARTSRSMPVALRDRLLHVGYYLVDETGGREFLHSVGYRPPISKAVQLLFHRFPDEVYIIGIELVTLATVVTLIMSLVRNHDALGLIVSAFLLLIPATQAAVELINYFVTAVLTPRPLAKFDFSKAVDPSCATMVAIPTLLINEKQIHQLVDDLEVRYLVNRDPNIFYALLTDLPDSAEPPSERDARIDLAIRLIDDLNRKYGKDPYGGFYLFHRHSVYNPREGTWMGWERKRGKLLDLNQMLRKAYDPFPVKAGDLSRLPFIRYVLTLDSDTQLPRGSAQRLIGTIAHPLNCALVDPKLNIVTRGYGIMQPRVGISVHSATRSRLASIYSGQTGFDIYSRAVSDVYQDLYGEGIFTGKGIYDVDALRQVLEKRFPRNALLSHDLIEGAYARAGLISDIEVIDDYPSHYSAYNRRRHRWLRGDWQIARWIFGRVPDESGRLVPNPISLISKWKIIDNLRRSLVEPATFLLLVCGWFGLPGGPSFWTLVTLALLFLPIYFRLVFSLFRAAMQRKWDTARESFLDFLTSHVSIALNIAFLAHQSLVALDAIIRTMIRSTITHSRLLEWETATEAELGIRKRTPVDIYLDWMPLLAAVLAVALYFKPQAAPYALPFIITWFCSKLISSWLNRSPHSENAELRPGEHRFLRVVALRTWRYFAEFSNGKNNWLIPDNVQEEPYRLAERMSPTNLGLLFNARQAAVEFGYLTVSEFVAQTENTLQSCLKLPRYHGHFLNWYNNITRQPLAPLFISSVDSGNLVASLWSLKQGCLELLREPVFRQNTLSGLGDHYTIVGGKGALAEFKRISAGRDPATWLPLLFGDSDPHSIPSNSAGSNGQAWWSAELRNRILALQKEVRDFAPWLQPEFKPLREISNFELDLSLNSLIPGKAESFYRELDRKLGALETNPMIARLREELPACRERLGMLALRLRSLADECDRLAREMNFEMLVDADRRLLSIGYDVTKQELNKSCYDLLASESRTATFIAVAKGETVQESWFRLGRQHTLCEGERVLISWTGTMFEYLMPLIWERSHPNTLLDRAVRAAVRAQQGYARARRVPWGISEAAYSKTDAEGNYQYHAFGVPGLALSVARENTLVISPYSSCLALLVDPATAVENLMRMARRKWLSHYGFFESIDFSGSVRRLLFPRKHVVVRCWMSHHQGMSLAAICNVLYDSPFQRWFHAEPLVQASDLLLQERPLRVKPIADTQPRRILSFVRNGLKGPAAKAKPAA
ncbi:MAG: glucoamylase family protein [Bryobacteraceae bacterium]